MGGRVGQPRIKRDHRAHGRAAAQEEAGTRPGEARRREGEGEAEPGGRRVTEGGLLRSAPRRLD